MEQFVHQERQQTLDDLQRQRIATLAAFHVERLGTIADLHAERLAATADLRGERQAMLDALRGQEVAIVSDMTATSEKENSDPGQQRPRFDRSSLLARSRTHAAYVSFVLSCGLDSAAVVFY